MPFVVVGSAVVAAAATHNASRSYINPNILIIYFIQDEGSLSPRHFQSNNHTAAAATTTTNSGSSFDLSTAIDASTAVAPADTAATLLLLAFPHCMRAAAVQTA